jgi:hypothetical protein
VTRSGSSCWVFSPPAGIHNRLLAQREEILEAEREAASSERDAYRAFAQGVETMDVDRNLSGPPAGDCLRLDASSRPLQPTHPGWDPGLTQVLDLYRETVLVDVEEADDTRFVVQDLAAEIGADLAGRVIHAETLRLERRAALVQSAREAAARRDYFVSTLDRKAGMLDADQTFAPVAMVDEISDSMYLATRSFDELHDILDRLTAHRATIADHLEERQIAIYDDPFNRNRTDGLCGELFQEDLYEQLKVKFPMLATCTEELREVRAARRRVQSAFARRV